MRLPRQTASVQVQATIQPMGGTIQPAFLDSLIDGFFNLGALACELFSGSEREDCLRGYNMVANPAKQILKPLSGLL